MNIETIKNNLKEKQGKTYKFKFNGARNQTEEFIGEIVEIYPAIFIIKTKENQSRIKSFTYSDILIDNLEILE